ncbi:hypothetical protein ACQPYK_10740 [Streptosporangium sp. CA-135522]|uniref:hypothetical protein n=1 Tax=Streptosporangium sp. CA-135522 TaxID=3240072 RepID=UPI003D8A6560
MPTLIDQIMVDPDFSERHEITVPASRERVWDAVNALEPSDIKAARPLFAARNLVARLRHGHEQRDIPAFSAHPMVTDPGRELVQGLAGQWWRLGTSDNLPPFDDPAAFQAFDEPGYVKAAFGFVLLDDRPGRIRLVTETRLLATSPDARRVMGRYWRVIRPGSGLIRRVMLGAIRERATG